MTVAALGGVVLEAPYVGELAAVVCTGLAVAALANLVVPPTPRLAPRLRPYTVTGRATLGRGVDALGASADAVVSGGGPRRPPGAPLERLAASIGRLVDRGADEALTLRLRQAGWWAGSDPGARVRAYRVRQLASAAMAALALAGAALAAGWHPLTALVAVVAGAAAGAARARGRLDRAIQQRRSVTRIELYTVNQLLAMHVRVGGGVVQALQRVVDRCGGMVSAELADVLAAHRSGRPLSWALERAAATTPEPHAARTYKLLAAGAEFGADLADGLRALSEDIRTGRAEALKRTATARRAAMLVPIIAILAPVMLLFVAAPLPGIVTGAW